MREKHLNTFDGVIDSDTDPLFIKQGDYLDAVNLVSGLSGMGKHLESIQGRTHWMRHGRLLPRRQHGDRVC